MKKLTKLLALALAVLMMFALAACGSKDSSDKSDDDDKESTEASETKKEDEEEKKSDNEVDSIDMDCEKGSIRYVRFEPAVYALTRSDGNYVFVFEYTNNSDEPSEVQRAFSIQFFQNGVELSGASTYYGDGGEQYDLVGAYFNDVLKGGTVTFGRIVTPTDDSPITVMVRYHDDDSYQMMVVDLKEPGSSDGDASDVNADDVDAALQGTWVLQGSNYFTFDNGSLSILSGGTTMNGTYTVNTADGNIDGALTASNGTVNIHMPFTFENGTLTLYNNGGEALVKQ